MNNVVRRFFALFLAFVMCFSLMPVSSFAEESDSANGVVEEVVDSDEPISLGTVPDEDALTVDESGLDTAQTTDSVNAIATGVDGNDNPAISVFEINEQFNPADTFNAASVSINIDYSEPLSCGTPTVFTMNLSGISDTSQCIYRLDTIYTGSGSTREMLIDSSRVVWNDSTFGYKSSNTFQFTFLASGVYSLKFAFMDKGTTPVTTGNKEITITITDPKYPSLAEICQGVAAECCAKCSTDYEKAVWLNDWLIDNCSYDNSLLYCNPEGVLARHTGTCNSYTKAYGMLLNEVGIPNTTATGNGHIWSVIQLGGEWYQVDTTWNDNYDSSDDTARHMYFGLTDDLMKLAHSDHTADSWHECTSLEDNYFIRSGKVSQWSDPLKETIKNRIAGGETEFDVSVAQNEYETYETKIKYSLAAYDLSQRITEDSNGAPCTVECSYTSKAIHISAEATTIVASGECGAALTWTLFGNGTLSISGSGAMKDYDYDSAPWYDYSFCIKTVMLPKDLTGIGNYAFKECVLLKSISLPAGVTSIGDSAFISCSSLENMTIPASVTSIGSAAFRDCYSMTSFTIPAGVTSIGDAVFSGCFGLTSISVDNGNSAYCSADGMLMNKSRTALLCCPGGKSSVSIPGSVTSIGSWAFAGCGSLTSITIPEDVTSIGDWAFGGAYSLTSITLPAGVTSIGNNTFYGCYGLKSVNIPAGVTSIGDFAFFLCDSLADVYYGGNNERWSSVRIGSDNDDLSSAVIHYCYIVTFDATLGTGAPEAQVKRCGELLIISSTAPTRTGYLFLGWSDRLNATTVQYKPGGTYSTDSDVILYAIWKPYTYSVVFNSNGGSGSMTSLAGRKYDTDYEFPANKFTRKGYSFVEWNIQKDGNGKSFTDGASYRNLCSSNGEKVILYAQWIANQYTVRFDANGGTGYMDDQVFSYDSLQALTPNALSKEGYRFAGWKLGKTTYKDCQSVKNLTVLADDVITLTAQWTADKGYSGYSYVVSFNGNSATKGSMKPQSLNVGTSKALTANSFSKTGYNFIGWALDSNGETVFSNKTKVKDLNMEYSSNTITLFAVWQPNKYSITFNGNGGKYIPDGSTKVVTTYTQTQTYDESGTLEICRFERNGYEFAGWATKSSAKSALYSDGLEDVFNLTATNNGKTILYAVWTPITYAVTYTFDGGVNAVANPTEYNTTQSISLKAATRPGYTFAGWYDDLTGKKVTGIAKGSLGDKSYTAHWTINTYNVKYNANGGKGSALTVKGLKYGEEQLVVETNWFGFPGYSFAGWNTKADCSGTTYLPNYVVDFNAKNGATVNLYAMWEYTVDLDANGGEGDVGSIILIYNHPELLPSEFIRDGFVFVGWNTNQAKASAGTALYKSTAQIKNIGLDKTLYAAWKPVTYTIKFNGNGSTSGGMSAQTATYDKILTLKTNSFKRTGYTFVGWAFTPEGEAKFINSEKVLNLTSTNKVIVNLYAKWQKN